MRGLLIVVLLASGCAGGTYNFAYRVTHGNATAPPSTSKGVASMIRYREYAGPIGKGILLLLNAPIEPVGTTVSETSSDSSRSCSGEMCTITTRTTTRVTYTPPTRAELEQFQKDKDEFQNVTAPAILSGQIGVEVSLDVASKALGGDTSGVAMGMHKTLFSVADDGWAISMKAGIGFAAYRMTDRTTRHLATDPGDPRDPDPMVTSVYIEESTGDVKSSYFGIPVRMSLATPLRFAAYYQFDWNLLRSVSGRGTRQGETYHPQLTTFGIETMLWRFHLAGELQLDQFNPASRAFAVEAGFVF